MICFDQFAKQCKFFGKGHVQINSWKNINNIYLNKTDLQIDQSVYFIFYSDTALFYNELFSALWRFVSERLNRALFAIWALQVVKWGSAFAFNLKNLRNIECARTGEPQEDFS